MTPLGGLCGMNRSLKRSIGFGKDHTGSFTIDLDAIETHPDQFTVLER